MKRILTLSIMAIAAISLMAQQYIYKTDGTIVRAYIIQADEQKVICAKHHDLAEPYDTISLSEVYNIVYKNGSFDIINEAGQVEDKGSILSQPLASIEYNKYKLVSYGGKSIRESEWLALASQAQVADMYGKGKALRRTGIPLWASGLGFVAVGGATMLAGYQNNSNKLVIAGETLALFGAPLVLVGIPLHCVGNSKMQKSYQKFNDYSRRSTSLNSQPSTDTPQLTLNLQSSANGIGIALNF